MKCRELVAYLQTQDPDAEVVRFDDAEGFPRTVATWDLNLGLRLLTWEDYGKYQLDPSPVTLEEAMA